MKHRIVHFTEKFENNMVNVIINEDVINFDCLSENGWFIKEKENVINNDDIIIENEINSNGNVISSESVSCSSGGNRCSSGNDEG